MKTFLLQFLVNSGDEFSSLQKELIVTIKTVVFKKSVSILFNFFMLKTTLFCLFSRLHSFGPISNVSDSKTRGEVGLKSENK